MQIPYLDASSPVHFNSSLCQSNIVTSQVDIALANDEVICGVVLAMRGISPALALRLQLYKDGDVNITFTWPDLTAGIEEDELANEEFYNNFFYESCW